MRWLLYEVIEICEWSLETLTSIFALKSRFIFECSNNVYIYCSFPHKELPGIKRPGCIVVYYFNGFTQYIF